MSTRCNIILQDKYDKLFFYRHSDGYPEGALPLLNKFLEWIKEGKIRNNISQSAGWLILLGAAEYQTIEAIWFQQGTKDYDYCEDFNNLKFPQRKSDFMSWKVGSIEPTIEIHGDVEWVYTIDLDKKTLEYCEACEYAEIK